MLLRLFGPRYLPFQAVLEGCSLVGSKIFYPLRSARSSLTRVKSMELVSAVLAGLILKTFSLALSETGASSYYELESSISDHDLQCSLDVG